MAARMAMMAMTTNNSMRVNPRCCVRMTQTSLRVRVPRMTAYPLFRTGRATQLIRPEGSIIPALCLAAQDRSIDESQPS
jgi:hypothetical protein